MDHFYYMGVDPGMSGAVALVRGDLTDAQFFNFKNQTEQDIWKAFLAFASLSRSALIERVSAMPKQGVSSTFKFGQSFGMLRAFLIATQQPFEMIGPVQWQKGLSLNKKYASTTERKNAHKAKAQELFPLLKITHSNADALLIAVTNSRR